MSYADWLKYILEIFQSISSFSFLSSSCRERCYVSFKCRFSWWYVSMGPRKSTPRITGISLFPFVAQACACSITSLPLLIYRRHVLIITRFLVRHFDRQKISPMLPKRPSAFMNQCTFDFNACFRCWVWSKHEHAVIPFNKPFMVSILGIHTSLQPRPSWVMTNEIISIILSCSKCFPRDIRTCLMFVLFYWMFSVNIVSLFCLMKCHLDHFLDSS